MTENKPAYMVNAMKFGERLRIARERKGLTQKALAELVGIKQPTVHHLENTKKDAAGSKFTVDLARVLGVSAAWLADEIGEMVPDSDHAPVDLSPGDQQIADTAQYLPPEKLDALIETVRLQAEEKRALYEALVAQRHADETREPTPAHAVVHAPQSKPAQHPAVAVRDRELKKNAATRPSSIKGGKKNAA